MYSLPEKIKGQCDEETYNRWLYRRAASLRKRDKKHSVSNLYSLKEYRDKVHEAVLNDADVDAYTGERMNWSLISTFDNSQAREGGKQYRKTFANMPTVDHDIDGKGMLRFRICSWRTNDSKNDLTVNELKTFCIKVLQYQEKHT